MQRLPRTLAERDDARLSDGVGIVEDILKSQSVRGVCILIKILILDVHLVRRHSV